MSKLYKKYQKKADYSFVFGVYSAIEILRKKPGVVARIITDDQQQMNSQYGEIVQIAQQNNIFVDRNPTMLRRIAPQENHTIAVIFKKYTQDIEDNSNHLVLCNPQYGGNLGTIIRSAHGFSMKNIAIIRPSVDHFDPKVIRASMGSIFSINIKLFNSFAEYKQAFPLHNLYTFSLSGKPIEEVSYKPLFSLVFGNEGAGLSGEVISGTQQVAIRHSPEIDSLNVTIAASIGMYKAFTSI